MICIENKESKSKALILMAKATTVIVVILDANYCICSSKLCQIHLV